MIHTPSDDELIDVMNFSKTIKEASLFDDAVILNEKFLALAAGIQNLAMWAMVQRDLFDMSRRSGRIDAHLCCPN